MIAASVAEDEITWLNRYIDGDDFYLVNNREKMWSETMAVSIEEHGNVTRMILCSWD